MIVIAGSNDPLQSRGLLSRLTDGSIPSNEVIGEAIMALLSAMTEVDASVKPNFKDHFCAITGVRLIARTPTVCVHDSHNTSGGTIQRDNTCAEQNG